MNLMQMAIKARELLSDPEHWIQDTLARDARGRFADPESEEAVCWCILGAFSKAADSNMLTQTELGVELAAQVAPGKPVVEALEVITNFNDDEHRTHPEVLEWFDTFIKGLE